MYYVLPRLGVVLRSDAKLHKAAMLIGQLNTYCSVPSIRSVFYTPYSVRSTLRVLRTTSKTRPLPPG